MNGTYTSTKLLGKIGNDITSTRSVDEIIDKVYANLNTLMDAAGFGIGVHKPEQDLIEFPLYIEGDQSMIRIHTAPRKKISWPVFVLMDVKTL